MVRHYCHVLGTSSCRQPRKHSPAHTLSWSDWSRQVNKIRSRRHRRIISYNFSYYFIIVHFWINAIIYFTDATPTPRSTTRRCVSWSTDHRQPFCRPLKVKDTGDHLVGLPLLVTFSGLSAVLVIRWWPWEIQRISVSSQIWHFYRRRRRSNSYAYKKTMRTRCSLTRRFNNRIYAGSIPRMANTALIIALNRESSLLDHRKTVSKSFQWTSRIAARVTSLRVIPRYLPTLCKRDWNPLWFVPWKWFRGII